MKILWATKKLARQNYTIPDAFHDVVGRHPNKPCFLFEDEVWSFKKVIFPDTQFKRYLNKLMYYK